jgi:tRNA-dihydrouridine synthase B
LSLLAAVALPKLTIPGNLFMAPMAGYTDAAFRALCVQQGAFLCFTEMVSAEGLARGGQASWALLARAENEQFWGVQLFGSDPRALAEAVRLLAPLRPSLVDLNCGCSVPKVLKSGAGAALLRSPARIGELVAAMRGQTDAPVTLKIRSGWDSSSLNYLEVARQARRAGAAAVCLHPRTRAQGFTGRADWSQIARLKASLEVPVFGSGDVFSAADAARLARETGCDAVFFARGALGNPFLFAEARRLFAGLPPGPEPSPAERLRAALQQLDGAVRLYGEAAACRQMRKHFCAYTRGLPGGARLRSLAVAARRVADYRALAEEYLRTGKKDMA